MNKKLFALLTSAAIVAACAPCAFAEANEGNDNGNNSEVVQAEAAKFTLDLKGAETVAAGEEATIDVYVTSDVHMTGVAFNFTIEGGEIVDFAFDDAAVEALGFNDSGWTKTQTEESKAAGNEDYSVMLGDYNMTSEVPTTGKIGTLTVKGANAGDVITVNTKNNAALYDYGDAEADWTTNHASITVTEAAESSEADSSEASSVADSASSVVDSATSSTTSTTDSSSKATTNNSSKAGTNGTTSNTNTGAASTAAVALAASAAALVVISKKRK